MRFRTTTRYYSESGGGGWSVYCAAYVLRDEACVADVRKG
jgi:hypothetical protein